jgi:hypothetical protein
MRASQSSLLQLAALAAPPIGDLLVGMGMELSRKVKTSAPARALRLCSTPKSNLGERAIPPPNLVILSYKGEDKCR